MQFSLLRESPVKPCSNKNSASKEEVVLYVNKQMPSKKKQKSSSKSLTIEIGNTGASDATEEKPKIKRKRLDNFQLSQLEQHFSRDIYPTTQKKEEVAKQLQLHPQVVAKWFINRRVKLRNEEKEKEGKDDDDESQSASKASSASSLPTLKIVIGPQKEKKDAESTD